MVRGLNAKFYAQTSAGFVNVPENGTHLDAGVKLGGDMNYKNTYLKVQAGAGTTFNGKIEVGHEFDIGRNMGLDISAKAQMHRVNSESSIENVINSDGTMYVSQAKWNPKSLRTGIGGQLTFKSNSGRAKFGVGVEGGYISSSSAESVLRIANDKENVICRTAVNPSGGTPYVTPKVSADVALNKKGNLSFVANADLYQGQAGIRFTF